MLDSLFKLIDPKKLGFKDKCTKETERGLGILCGTLVFFLIVSLVMQVLGTFILYNRCKGHLKNNRISYTLMMLISLLYSVFVIVFMINACKMCNGLYAFLFIIVLGVVFSFISNLVFSGVNVKLIQCLV